MDALPRSEVKNTEHVPCPWCGVDQDIDFPLGEQLCEECELPFCLEEDGNTVFTVGRRTVADQKYLEWKASQ